ncbi:MAG: hypothetical protein ACE145_15410 [Terriglobia bacterium]
MSLTEIKHAIEGLPEEQRTALADWLWNLERKDWDRQITEDFSPGGRGAKLLDEVDAAIERGEFKPME